MDQIPNSSPSSKVGLVASMVNRVRLVARLVRDPRVPAVLKVVPFAPLAYVLMPIDFLPDLAPILGQIDDIGFLILGIETFIMLSPNDVVEEHKAAIAAGEPYKVSRPGTGPQADATPRTNSSVIDGDYREVK